MYIESSCVKIFTCYFSLMTEFIYRVDNKQGNKVGSKFLDWIGLDVGLAFNP